MATKLLTCLLIQSSDLPVRKLSDTRHPRECATIVTGWSSLLDVACSTKFVKFWKKPTCTTSSCPFASHQPGKIGKVCDTIAQRLQLSKMSGLSTLHVRCTSACLLEAISSKAEVIRSTKEVHSLLVPSLPQAHCQRLVYWGELRQTWIQRLHTPKSTPINRPDLHTGLISIPAGTAHLVQSKFLLAPF